MPANRPAAEEPRLTVTRPPRRRLRRARASALPVPVIGTALLVTSGRVAAPGDARRPIPAGTFTARCLGKMTGWHEDSREVTLEAIAIFW